MPMIHSWQNNDKNRYRLIFSAFLPARLAHHRVENKNLDRLNPLTGLRCYTTKKNGMSSKTWKIKATGICCLKIDDETTHFCATTAEIDVAVHSSPLPFEGGNWNSFVGGERKNHQEDNCVESLEEETSSESPTSESPGTGNRRAWSSARPKAARISRARTNSLRANRVSVALISCTRCFWKALI